MQYILLLLSSEHKNSSNGPMINNLKLEKPILFKKEREQGETLALKTQGTFASPSNGDSKTIID